jgi:DNA repair protein RadA/Sms
VSLPRPVPLAAVRAGQVERTQIGLSELDRVLGGGLVAGSAILLGGEPGIGKSTLALQCSALVAVSQRTLYVSGEESLEQLGLRARRMKLEHAEVPAMAENRLELVLAAADQEASQFLVVDSIQALYSERVESSPGSISQIRECADQLIRFAKRSGTALLLIGHVTKEGVLAGPKLLEHLVDTVLYFEGDTGSRYRLVRAFKNRFGAVNEVGVFAMTDHGLKVVSNPSAIFLSRGRVDKPGSMVMVTQEGTRPLLVEVQALVDGSSLANPRRLCVGLDGNRLGMLLAVLHRHGGIALAGHDVFINVAGGVRVTETAADVAMVAAVASSHFDRVIPPDTACFGELGLSGEIRPVQKGEERLAEAAKLGFKRALIPQANRIRKPPAGLEIVPLRTVSDLLEQIDTP